MWLLIPTLSLGLAAQTTTSTKRRSTATRQTAAAPVTASDIQALREALTEQQRQIQQLREELQRRDQAIAQQGQQLNQLQNAAQQAQNQAGQAEDKSSQSAGTVAKLQGDVADMKLNQTNSAVSTQEDQKRVAALEGFLNRFRFNGDVRVRYENFFQSYDGCTPANCPDRHRARVRLRLGLEGKLNEDFFGAIYMASGLNANATASFADPVSTNQTLTEFFTRKTIGFDRGYLTYNPQAHKWLDRKSVV